MNRRDFLGVSLGAVAASNVGADEAPRRGAALGVISHSFSIRRADAMSPLRTPRGLAEHAQPLGAAGIQTNLGTLDADACARLRDRLAELRLYVEGDISLPRNQADIERFDGELRTAKACGAEVLRAALGGRRYEVFTTAQQFRDYRDRCRQAVALARPSVERHEV